MNRYHHKGLPLLKPTRALSFKKRKRTSVIRIFVSIAIIACAAYVIFGHGLPVRALETIQISAKASALVLEDTQAHSSLSFTPKAPHKSVQKDPCLPLLHKAHLSPGVSDHGVFNMNQRPSAMADKKAASVALGLFLGARIALGPKEIVQKRGRIHVGPQFRAANDNGQTYALNYALSVAAYRSCKNNYVLSLRP